MNVMIEEGCISCGLCENVCPEVFKLNEDGISEVIAEPEPEDEDNVREAAENCPVSVIIVDSGE
jgi:ferredoxin